MYISREQHEDVKINHAFLLHDEQNLSRSEEWFKVYK